MIISIKYLTNWIFIRQHKQAQIEIYIIHEKPVISDHYNIVGDQVMLRGEITLNMNPRLKFSIKMFKHGQTKPLPSKREQSQID